MLKHLRRRVTFANVTSVVALFVALGGTSYAALTITGKNVKNSSLTGADIKNSSLTTRDVKNRSLLASDFKAGQIPAGPQGPKGDTGAQGPKGDKGDPGEPATRLWAAVQGGATGTLLRGSGAVSVSKFGGTGQYRVLFDRDVRNCAWVATPGDPTTDGSWGTLRGDTAATSSLSSDPVESVRVETSDGAGNLQDGGFFLAVFC